MNLIEITNKSGKVKLIDAVTPWSVEKLTEDIGKLFGAKALESGTDFSALINAGGEALDELEIIINSPGGSIFDGYNVFTEIMSLRERGVVVTATVTGMAASMASVICMACDIVRMVPHGRMMIHEASNGVHGNAEAHRRAAELLDGISNDIAVIYANRTKATVEEIRNAMKDETWMNAKEALTAGFIDSIYDPSNEKNAVDIAAMNLKSRDMSFLDRLTNPSDTEAQERIIALEANISQHDQVIAGYEAKLTIAETALAEVETLKAENLSLVAKVETIATLEASIAELTEKAVLNETKIGEAAAQLLAAQGHSAPVDLSQEKPESDKPKTENLTGFAKASAFFAKK